MKRTSFVVTICIVAIFATLVFPASAQTIFGTILGTVTDPSGAGLPNIVVIVTNQGENISREVRTDAQGNYQAENMKAGIYTVSVKAAGFKDMGLTDIRLEARQAVRADMR